MSKTSLVNRADRDPVSTVLKWVLLVVGFATAMLLFWTTLKTYQGVPPQPQCLTENELSDFSGL
ncbi:hypothetical protein NBRC106471_2759 [Acetobacter pasteurianus subsp. pasteurianus LMG 1262 = NBRC 106471]|nr:hypothetical protein NBRC106471_2759 [Acetobacter pasteurianus subsp. pasteurianus LMG 1262 = NBRC 106471]